MAALLEKSGVIDDPGFHGLALDHRIDGVVRGHPAHGLVVPRSGTDEVEEPLMGCVHLLRIATHQGGYGLDALALRAAKRTHGVDRERGATLGVAEYLADRAK